MSSDGDDLGVWWQGGPVAALAMSPAVMEEESRFCLLGLHRPQVRRRFQRVKIPFRSFGWRIRISPVGPDVEIRNTGPPMAGVHSDSRCTSPDPPTICTAAPSGTRTSIEPQVSRRRLISRAVQLAEVRSTLAAPKPVQMVVSVANCQPGTPAADRHLVRSRTMSGLARRREAGVTRTSRWSAAFLSLQVSVTGRGQDHLQESEKVSSDNSPTLNRS